MVELRSFFRASKEYRIEYGPFPLSKESEQLHTSVIKNIGGGGLMFHSREEIPIGRQLILKILITGWRQEGEDLVETPDEDSEVPINAIAEVKRCDFDFTEGLYEIGVQFLGRILNQAP